MTATLASYAKCSEERLKEVTLINSGAYGNVYTSMDSNFATVALKVCDLKENPDRECAIPDFIREWAFASAASHPNVMDSSYLWIGNGTGKMAYKMMNGNMGNLAGRESTKKLLPSIYRQMVSAMEFMHSNGFSHRDVKLGNFLYLRHNNGEINIKISDFGTTVRKSCYPYDWSMGTPYYAAPELTSPVKGDMIDGFKADVWALGVSMLDLLNYFIDYETNSSVKYSTQEKIREHLRDQNVGEDLMDLLFCMLNPDPKERCTIQDALYHPYFDSLNEPPGTPDSKRPKIQDIGYKFVKSQPFTLPAHQTDINEKMMPILIQWLNDVCEEYDNKFDKEVVDTATRYLYTYINLEKGVITRNWLQLVGVSCLLISSCLLTENNLTQAKAKFWCDNCYTKKEIEHCLSKILSTVSGYIE